jgi:hypothetical protein
MLPNVLREVQFSHLGGAHVIAEPELVGHVKDEAVIGDSGTQGETIVIIGRSIGRRRIIKNAGPQRHNVLAADDQILCAQAEPGCIGDAGVFFLITTDGRCFNSLIILIDKITPVGSVEITRNSEFVGESIRQAQTIGHRHLQLIRIVWVLDGMGIGGWVGGVTNGSIFAGPVVNACGEWCFQNAAQGPVPVIFQRKPRLAFQPENA